MKPNVIELINIGRLSLQVPTTDRGLLHISAASGLVLFKEKFFVVSDDELHLAIFPKNNIERGTLFTFVDEVLPIEAKERKKQKPDWEALVLLPKTPNDNYDSLLLIPSGSTKKRFLGFLIYLDNEGMPFEAKSVDFTELYRELGHKFSELNIEGATIAGEELKLFQRGNGVLKQNGIINLNLLKIRSCLQSSGILQIPSDSIISTKNLDLGCMGKTIIGPGDATTIRNEKILLVGSAEDSENTYDDGAIVGAGIGLLNQASVVEWFIPFRDKIKPEGVAVEEDEFKIKVYIVTDPDDADQASTVYIFNLDKKMID